MSDPEMDGLETTHKEQDTPGTSRRKKTKEVQDLSSALGKTASISPERGEDDYVEEMKDREVEQNKGEVTSPRDEEEGFSFETFFPKEIKRQHDQNVDYTYS
jgi:hypothetical protein